MVINERRRGEVWDCLGAKSHFKDTREVTTSALTSRDKTRNIAAPNPRQFAPNFAPNFPPTFVAFCV